MSGLSFDTPKVSIAQNTGAKPKVRTPPLAAISPTQVVQDTPEPGHLNHSEFFSAQSQVIIHFISVSSLYTQ